MTDPTNAPAPTTDEARRIAEIEAILAGNLSDDAAVRFNACAALVKTGRGHLSWLIAQLADAKCQIDGYAAGFDDQNEEIERLSQELAEARTDITRRVMELVELNHASLLRDGDRQTEEIQQLNAQLAAARAENERLRGELAGDGGGAT